MIEHAAIMASGYDSPIVNSVFRKYGKIYPVMADAMTKTALIATESTITGPFTFFPTQSVFNA